MQTTPSRKATPKISPDQWAQRHRLQHRSGRPVDERTSKRFAQDFERALRARGAEAKKEFEERRVQR